jgi:hypothetical protein
LLHRHEIQHIKTHEATLDPNALRHDFRTVAGDVRQLVLATSDMADENLEHQTPRNRPSQRAGNVVRGTRPGRRPLASRSSAFANILTLHRRFLGLGAVLFYITPGAVESEEGGITQPSFRFR